MVGHKLPWLTVRRVGQILMALLCSCNYSVAFMTTAPSMLGKGRHAAGITMQAHKGSGGMDRRNALLGAGIALGIAAVPSESASGLSGKARVTRAVTSVRLYMSCPTFFLAHTSAHLFV